MQQQDNFYTERYARTTTGGLHTYSFEPSNGPVQFQRSKVVNELGQEHFEYSIKHSNGTVKLVDFDAIYIYEADGSERLIISNDRSSSNNQFTDLRLNRIVDFSETYHKDVAGQGIAGQGISGIAKSTLPKGLCSVKHDVQNNISSKLGPKK